MNSLLNDFYHAWWDWVESGAPEDNEFGFDSSMGLCSSLENYSVTDSWEKRERISATQEMEEQFDYYGLDPILPFNRDFDDYIKEEDKTKNKLRTSFVWMNMVPKDKA